RCPSDNILELLNAAFRVRERYFGKRVIIQLLINAKSGLCSEDCAYCSQSAVSEATIEKYPLLDEDIIIKGAHTAKSSHARRYCIVTSGYAPSKQDVDRLCRVVRNIKKEVDIEICNSLGHLSEETALKLKEAGVDRYNHNLNTAERLYPQICTTHSYSDRIQTLQNARAAGLELCCGALFGMGETDDDIIDIALALRDVKASSIPVNFLNPIPGTALEKIKTLNPIKCLSILCLMRFLNPSTEIRIAGGREFHLRSLQPLGLYPANSIFVSGYLTTEGQSPDEAVQMITDMGFEIEPEAIQKIRAV
ncbi:MAG: biotin synthase BioB, partial [Dehalococcoidia bacterium]|nr:biotin synthase BioB [Dehalococcoidia bacterium]